MSTSRINITTAQRDVIPGRIFVANADAAKDHQLLASLGVTAVISVGGGKKGAAAPGVAFLHFGIKDRSDTTYLPVFQKAAEFAGPILLSEEGGSVLVHCRGGMHRSPAVAASLLIALVGLTSTEAIQCVQAARPIADFGVHLVKELRLYEMAMTGQQASAVTSRIDGDTK